MLDSARCVGLRCPSPTAVLQGARTLTLAPACVCKRARTLRRAAANCTADRATSSSSYHGAVGGNDAAICPDAALLLRAPEAVDEAMVSGAHPCFLLLESG